MRTIVMMLGELDYTDIFFPDRTKVLFLFFKGYKLIRLVFICKLSLKVANLFFKSLF